MEQIAFIEDMERFDAPPAGAALLEYWACEQRCFKGNRGLGPTAVSSSAYGNALMWVISIGTNEIQRSLIGQRGLGLPR